MEKLTCTDCINKIKLKWQTSKYFKLVNELDKCIRGGSTGSEVSLRLFELLNALKMNQAPAYNEVKDEIDLFLEWIDSKRYLKTEFVC